MATITLGSSGFSATGDGESPAFFQDVAAAPYSALKEMLGVQHLKSVEAAKFTGVPMAVERHMPTRAPTANRIDNVVDYRVSVGYDNLINTGGLIDVTPSTSAFNVTRSIQGACPGSPTTATIASRGSLSSYACNPRISGPTPIVGHEAFTRQAFTSNLPIPAICFGDYTNKEGFYQTLEKTLEAVRKGVVNRFAYDRLKWMIGQSRYNAAPVVTPAGTGTVSLPDSDALFSQNTYGRVPEHYGSPLWIANMLRRTDIPHDVPLTVSVPVAILTKYKQQLFSQFGIDMQTSPGMVSKTISDYQVDVVNGEFTFLDLVSGRRIRFTPDTAPVYVEVVSDGPALGEMYFQEAYVTRASETSGQYMPNQPNPNYGRACSCSGRTLAAIITVTPDNSDKPFYLEGFPANPDAGLKSVVARLAADAKVNTNLAEFFTTSVKTTIFTGLECQRYVLDPLNQVARSMGWEQDLANNMLNTHMGGFVSISGVFVENNPRMFVSFLLAVPPQKDTCVEVLACLDDPTSIAAGGEFDFGTITETQPLAIPEPPEPTAAPGGSLFPSNGSIRFKAPCTDTRVVTLKIRRKGGTAGSKTITVTATPSTHADSVALASSVVFAEGETEKTLSITLEAWSTTTATSENFVITWGGDLGSGAHGTTTVCVLSNINCPDTCELDPACGC